MNADLATLDFVYNTADAWYNTFVAGTAKENDCVPSSDNTCHTPGVGGQTVKQLHDKIKADYQAGKAAINTLIQTYTAARQADIENLFKLISTLVIQIVSLITLLNGPNLSTQIPVHSYQVVTKAQLPLLR